MLEGTRRAIRTWVAVRQDRGGAVASVQYEMVRKGDGVKDVRTYPTTSAPGRRAGGRLDVAMVDPPSIAYQISTTDRRHPRVENYAAANAWKVGLAVNKGDRELLDAVNVALRKLKQTGQLKKILDGWNVGHLIAS